VQPPGCCDQFGDLVSASEKSERGGGED
jgi:hypothetical protein